MAKKKIQIIDIVQNNCITGVQYGLVEKEVFVTENISYIKEDNKTTPASASQKLPTPPKSVQGPIKQPSQRWANKMSAAKKRILDTQKQDKQK